MTILKLLAYSFIVIAALITFTSCCKSCFDTDRISIDYKNYRKHEIDTIVKIRYQPNSNFSILIDSSVHTRPNESQDTTYHAIAYDFVHLDADYIIKIPSVGKTFSFSNYQIVQQECGCDNEKVNVLKSFTFNGNLLYNAFVDLPR